MPAVGGWVRTHCEQLVAAPFSSSPSRAAPRGQLEDRRPPCAACSMAACLPDALVRLLGWTRKQGGCPRLRPRSTCSSAWTRTGRTRRRGSKQRWTRASRNTKKISGNTKRSCALSEMRSLPTARQALPPRRRPKSCSPWSSRTRSSSSARTAVSSSRSTCFRSPFSPSTLGTQCQARSMHRNRGHMRSASGVSQRRVTLWTRTQAAHAARGAHRRGARMRRHGGRGRRGAGLVRHPLV
mmetsp:Transcript_15974/g.53704  ORF Transcript_15974/g.53704 Transcript_15974/m.53704 type:complete len:239 (-) Transcript_15974:194-910(-)